MREMREKGRHTMPARFARQVAHRTRLLQALPCAPVPGGLVASLVSSTAFNETSAASAAVRPS
eukprot:4076697-Pleurochrysis_carterae.AAC.1